jgi:hypothetical protein
LNATAERLGADVVTPRRATEMEFLGERDRVAKVSDIHHYLPGSGEYHSGGRHQPISDYN